MSIYVKYKRKKWKTFKNAVKKIKYGMISLIFSNTTCNHLKTMESTLTWTFRYITADYRTGIDINNERSISVTHLRAMSQEAANAIICKEFFLKKMGDDTII